MKTGQSVIVLTVKETGDTYIFGSLAAIYRVFNAHEIGMSYPSLRNAVSKFIKENNIDTNRISSVLIYDTPKSKFSLHRGQMVLSEKNEIG